MHRMTYARSSAPLSLGKIAAHLRLRLLPRVQLRELLRVEQTEVEPVIDVVAVVGDFIREVRHLRLERRLRGPLPAGLRTFIKARVLLQSLAHLVAEVQAGELRVARLDHIHDAQALLVVIKAAVIAHQFIQRLLAGVAEWRMPEVVRERDGLGEILVQPERARDGARDVCHLEGVREPRAQVIARAVEKNLRLIFQPPERAAVDDARAVALVVRAMRMLRLGIGAPLGVARLLRVRCEHHALLRLELHPRADHFGSPFVFSSISAISRSSRARIARAVARMIRMSKTASSTPVSVIHPHSAQ